MKKNLIMFSLLIICCSQKNKYLIDNKSIGSLYLNQRITKKIDQNVFNIRKNNDGLITSIVVNSKKYKTKEGFGIGTHFDEFRSADISILEKEIKLSKGNTIIGAIGNSIIYNNISFVDTNKDNLVDFVLINSN